VPPARPAVLETTLDLELQRAADEELRKAAAFVEEHYGSPPEWGALCLADMEGEVLAMVSYRGGKRANEAAFAPLQSLFEPGSVVKPLVFSIALERGVLDWEGPDFDCTPVSGKAWRVPHSTRWIRDEHPSTRLRPRDILVVSSNIGAVQVGLLLGREGLAQYLESYRFGQATSLGLPGEAAGWLAPDRHEGGVMRMPQSEFWGYTAPSLSIGYEYNVTPVQLLRAYLTLLNGRPRDLQLYRRYAVGGEVTEVPLPVDGPRFLSEQTVARLRDAMRGVVSDENDHATGRILYRELLDRGAPPLAGKTGTSEIGGTRDGATVTVRTASFVGFAPVDRPRYVAVCVLQKPGAARFWGGSYAAPAAGRLLLHALSRSQVRRPSSPQVSEGRTEGVGVPARLAVGR
jgi:cell division protein FtsI (penicillin-binding protein 3)